MKINTVFFVPFGKLFNLLVFARQLDFGCKLPGTERCSGPRSCRNPVQDACLQAFCKRFVVTGIAAGPGKVQCWPGIAC